MKMFTGFEYLLIDLANQAGHDKLTFEERIKWAKDNLHYMESLADGLGKTKPLYIKACMAIRKAMAHEPTGHMVAMDAVCSGLQIMSVLTGCINGATATGLIDPEVRADAYGEVTNAMESILGSQVNVTRAAAKEATMTVFYGSKAKPIEIFGEATPEINAFYQAINQVAPGPWELLQLLIDSWKPYALSHEWKLPDGFDAKVKVEDTKEVRIEVDELDHSTFTYYLNLNEGTKKGISNPANVIQSIDAYILRSMHRRCNYNKKQVDYVFELLGKTHINDVVGDTQQYPLEGKVAYYYEQYKRSGIVDVVILPYLNEDNIADLGKEYRTVLYNILLGMRQYEPFELVTIHDSFAAHPNNVNWVRYQYKEILADLADSNVLQDILNQLYETPNGVYTKLSTGLSSYIRNSNYSLS